MSEEIVTIKGLLKKIGLDQNHLISIEYMKAQFHLMQIILRTEKVLIKIQEDEGLEVVSERQKSVNQTLTQLCFVHGKMSEMEGLIFQLRQENELLTQRIKIKQL